MNAWPDSVMHNSGQRGFMGIIVGELDWLEGTTWGGGKEGLIS